ncbi:MAG: S9 family peptidase, partial [Oxalobacteraceae bacterium]
MPRYPIPATALLLALSISTALAQDKANAAQQIADIELIPRDALFGNPERASVLISPDGKTLSWLAPVDGVMNVWVAPADDLSKAKAVTADTARGIRNYFWSYQPGTLLYLRDSGGDEDFHLFSVDIASGKATDLSPHAKTTAQVVGVSHAHADTILVGMNDRDPQWHDLYRVDLASGKRTLLEKNEDKIGGYLVDDDYRLRYATRSRPDGGQEVLQADGKGGWSEYDQIPFEDSQTTQPVSLTTDGKTLYMLDSRGRNTAALYAIDVASKDKKLVFEDARADVGNSLSDPRTGVAQAVAVDYLREEWTALDPVIGADLKKLQAIGPGEVGVNSRTYDDKTWIVTYSAAETPVVYYRYDRGAGGKLTKLFSARPALDGKPLVAQWPQEIKSRDGLTLVSYLTLPRSADANNDGKADAPVPLVLLVHGGPWARDGYGYTGTTQWLANRGYATLQVNYRGSTGFGKDFTNAGNGEWAAKMHDDLLDAVQWAVKQGVTTQDQVAIMGGSYGGYATLVGVT